MHSCIFLIPCTLVFCLPRLQLTGISTHEALNNATYADASKEISFNKVWLQHSGISSAKYFSPNGLIPPAITGMHNADVIKGWMDNGIKYVVGDNTRPPLFDTASSCSCISNLL
jgi:hypothetical protein